MGLPIERWVKQAKTALDTPPKRLLDDLRDLGHYERQSWRKRRQDLLREGELTALQGGFAGLVSSPLALASASVPSIAGTANLWDGRVYSPMPAANTYQAPAAFRIMASGIMSTVTSPGTQGWNATIGAGGVAGGSIAGSTLGSASVSNLTASIVSAGWYVEGDVTVRSIGLPGANSTAIGFFRVGTTQNTAGGLAMPAIEGPTNSPQMFGGVVASFDSSIAQAFSLGTVNTVTTINYLVHQVIWIMWD